jgi:hypothetical protein
MLGSSLPSWCFQGYDEFRELSRQKGNSQPITGMRSGSLVMRYTKENIEYLPLAMPVK